MAYVIIGASGGLGRALAERLAADGHRLVLVARDAAVLDTLAGELRDRHGIEATSVAADVAEGPNYLDRVISAAESSGGIDGLLLPLGLAVRDGIDCPRDTVRALAGVNFLAVVDAIGRLWPLMITGKATVVGFGSIAAARGRGRNLVYGAMKRALQYYFESLRVTAHGTPIAIQFWTLGFLDTSAMKDERTPLPKGDPVRLADKVVTALGRGSFTRHFPCWWWPITLVLKLLPWTVYSQVAGGAG